MTGDAEPPSGRRWQTPREDRTVLIDPPWREAASLLERSAAQHARRDGDLGGRRLAELAVQARAELLRAALEHTSAYRGVPDRPRGDRLLLAGHQPQMFHAGVWFKNFALAELARQNDATAVNLVVDNDTLKAAALRVPGGTPAAPQATAIDYDAAAADLPFEERAVLDRGLFESFGRRAAGHIAPLVPQPLLGRYWPCVVERLRESDNLGHCLAAGRHALEGELGWQSLELPQSRVCDLPAFQHFAAWLLLEGPRVREVYNRAVAEYRREHRVRSRNHPVPDLAAEDDWQEAPLWVWTADDPRRRRLFIRRAGRQLELSDRGRLRASLPAGEDATDTAAALADLRASGVKLRTRALITTLWSRLALGDLFLHGIGGGKYDRVTDLLAARLIGVRPAEYMVLSATLQLPIPRRRTTPDDLRTIDRQLRDLDYQPERWIETSRPPADAAGEPYAALQRKRAAVGEIGQWGATRQRHRIIADANAAMQPWVAQRREQLAGERAAAIERLRAEAVLASREYAFCLYPERTLLDFFVEMTRGKP